MEAYHAKLRPHAEQRVKQLASRITEAAVGIGRIKSRHIAEGAARPTSRVDAPCHAVVIESLTNYRPDELQTRRENRQLMEWSSAKVQKYLAESCQLHGLHLREVQPNYTSRQRRQLRPRRPTRH
jgi:IS605 OrfB family transposase